MTRIVSIIKHPLTILLVTAFLVLSWPFAHFPLTDGDVANWADSASEIRISNNFLSAPSDQGHGPLLTWTAAVLTKINSHSFYLYNLFNLVCGVLGLFLMYYFSLRLWKDQNISILCSVLFVTSISFVYLSRTPMYDWPATIFYFAFGGFYLLYARDHEKKDLIWALIAIGIGSLSRFSICLGLAGIYVFFISLIYRRSFFLLVRDGLAVLGAIIVFNLPWLISQVKVFGIDFFTTFIYDNTGRYIKSTRPNSYYRKDFYGLPIYVLLGMLPHTFYLIATFFQRGIVKRFKEDRIALALLAGFLPCLILFSFSGHTKLGRYIAYVFPFLTMLLGYFMRKYDLKDELYIKRCEKILFGTLILLAGLIALELLLYSQELEGSILFILSFIGLFFGLLLISYLGIKRGILSKNPMRLLPYYSILYILFFSILTYETFHAEFLINVKIMILQAIS